MLAKRTKPLKFVEHLKRYFQETTVHGFRYVIEGHDAAERILWITSITMTFALAGYMIKANVDDIARNPILTSVKTIRLQDVPFPAVTLSGIYLEGPGRLQESLLNSFKFDCIDDNETCIQETSSIRLDLLPLLEYTVKKLFERGRRSIIKSSWKKDYLSEFYFCRRLDQFKGYQSLAFAFAKLYDKSSDTTAFEKSLLKLIASMFRQPRQLVTDRLRDFVTDIDNNYVYEKIIRPDICPKWFREANFTTDAVYFSSAIMFASGLFDISPKVPLGTLLTGGELKNFVKLAALGQKPQEKSHPIWRITYIFSKLLEQSNVANLTVNSILEYLEGSAVEIEPQFLTGCDDLDTGLLFLDSEQFCATNSTGPCCKFEKEISKDYGTIWKIMKYAIAPVSRKVIEKSEKEELSTLINNYDYMLNNEYLKNENPVLLACKFGASSLNSDCSLFRKMFTTSGIGYTFNNAPFHYMYLNTTEIAGFFNEMYQLSFKNEDNLPQNIISNGKGHSFEFVFNNIGHSASFESQKLIVHDPNIIANARNEAVEIEPGMTIEISATPSVTVTDDNTLQLEPSQRSCLSKSERNLNIFRYYSQSGCLFECQLKMAVATCNCTAWNYPRIYNDTNLCWSLVATECFESQMKLSVNTDICDCPDDCTSVHYGISVQSKPLDVESVCKSGRKMFFRNLHRFLLKTNDLFTMNELQIYPKTCQEKVRETVTFVRVFVAPKTVSQMVRTTRVSFSGHLANLGGIIGLFTGMSVLSLAEIVFWLMRFAKSWMAAYMFPKRH